MQAGKKIEALQKINNNNNNKLQNNKKHYTT